MTIEMTPGTGILFMKVGTHAKEPLDEIISRKMREIDEGGFAMWGYGGNTCHPRTMVRPFASDFASRGQEIRLLMNPMDSKHFAEQVVAEDYSVDGEKWEPIDTTVHQVRGSRFALFIEELKEEKFDLPLSQTKVALGNCAGRGGHRYIQGHVDKACLEIADKPELVNDQNNKPMAIGFSAKLRPPYAAFLR